MPRLTPELKALKSLDLKRAPVTFWVVKRGRMRNQRAGYTVLRVEAEDSFRYRLRRMLQSHIADCSGAEPYSFTSGDQDDSALTLELSETDFEAIQEQTNAGSEAPHATSYDDLVGAWGYVVKAEVGPEPVYAFRQTSTFWSAKKVSGVSVLFRNEVLVDLADEKVFRIDKNLDFVAHAGKVFVLDKTAFERAMNFRGGMVKKRDAVFEEFAGLGRIDGIAVLRQKVGSKLPLLRKVATIHNRGYYRDSAFLDGLIKLNEEREWGLNVVGGVIVVTEETFETVLTLLGNDRLMSEINAEVFDVRGSKRKVNLSSS